MEIPSESSGGRWPSCFYNIPETVYPWLLRPQSCNQQAATQHQDEPDDMTGHILLTTAAAIALPAFAYAAETPIRTGDFIAGQGVNTHLPYTDGAYANVGQVIADLAYLGINHLRDGLNSPGQFGGAPLSSYTQVAQAGNHFTMMVGGGGSFASTGGTPTDPSLDQRIGYLDTLSAMANYGVVAVEGTNEINNYPIVFNGAGTSGQGQDELNAAVALQGEIYSRVHADHNMAGVPVAYFTGYNAGSIPVGPDPAATAGLADYDTQHPYPNNGDAPARWVSRTQALGNETAADAAARRPAIYTETGYRSTGGTSGGVSPDVQAKYTLDLLLDTAQSGIAQTDLYELLDAYAPGSPQGDAGYGLFDYTGAPKPVAVALHNLNTLLGDTSPAAQSFGATPLAYTVTGETGTGNHLLMQKASGVYILALWDEQPIWYEATGVQVSPVPHTVTVAISGRTISYIGTYDPTMGTNPTASVAGGTASVKITDHPVLLAIVPK